MTKSWDTGMKSLVLDCTQAEDRPKFFDIAKKLRTRRQTTAANMKSEAEANHTDDQTGELYADQ